MNKKDNGEVILTDLSIIDRDREINPIRQGNTLVKTQRKLEPSEFDNIKSYLCDGRKRKHSTGKIVKSNNEKRK